MTAPDPGEGRALSLDDIEDDWHLWEWIDPDEDGSTWEIDQDASLSQ